MKGLAQDLVIALGPASVVLVLLAVPDTRQRLLRRHQRPHANAHVDQALAQVANSHITHSRLPGRAIPPPVPGQAPGGGEGPAPEPRGGPSALPPPPGLTDDERSKLEWWGRARLGVFPQAASNGQRIADDLRLRLPHVADGDLGRATLLLHSYLVAATQAAPDPAWAMKCSLEGFGLAAEELTRLLRQPTHDERNTHG